MDVEIECEKCFIGVLILYICFASVIEKETYAKHWDRKNSYVYIKSS